MRHCKIDGVVAIFKPSTSECKSEALSPDPNTSVFSTLQNSASQTVCRVSQAAARRVARSLTILNVIH